MTMDFVGTGADEHIFCTKNTAFDNQTGLIELSLSAWMQADSDDGRQHIFDWGHNSSGSIFGWYWGHSSGNDNQHFEFKAGFTGTNLQRTSTTGWPPVGVWQHVALTWDGSLTAANCSHFRNGVLRPTYVTTINGTGSRDDDNNKEGMFLGIRGGLLNQNYNGRLDDVRIYDRVLSDAEIKTINAAKGTDGIVNGLVARWLLNEQSPGTAASGVGTIKDWGPSKIDGDPVNTPTYDSGILRFRRRA